MAEQGIYELEGWAGGLNRNVDVTALEEDELYEALDVEIDSRGDVSSRPGYSDPDNGTTQLVTMAGWWPDVDSGEILVARTAATDNFYVARGDAPFTLDVIDAGAAAGSYTTPTKAYFWGNFVSLNSDELYSACRRGSDKVWKLQWVDDATTPTAAEVAEPLFDINVAPAEGGTETADGFPRAYHALVKHERVWVANVTNTAQGDFPSRVFYSDVLKPEKWYALQYFDFNPDDGSEITAMIPYGEAILVFKNHNVSILTGKTEDSYAKTMLDEKVGTTSPKTARTIGALMLVFDRDQGVWRFDGAQFTNASEKIRDYLLDNVNYDYAFTASAFIRRGVYYLSVPWGSSKTPNRTFCYDIDGDLWYEWTYGVNEAAVKDGDVYGGVGGEVGYMLLFDGNDDDGSDIDAEIQTGWLQPGGGGSQHRIRRLDASFADEGANQEVEIEARADYDSSTFNNEYVFPAGEELWQRVGGFGGKRWEQLQLGVVGYDGAKWRLNKLSLRLNIARRGRGVNAPNG